MTHADPAHSTSSGFQPTQWSIVASAPTDPAALEGLLKAYWGPIYAFIRRTGAPRDAAADLTQEFISEVVLKREIIARADPERGRFRTFLKSAVKNFLVDQHRRSTAARRGGDAPPLGGHVLEAMEPADSDDPGSAFDRQWAATTLGLALERLRAECESAGQEAHWRAFKAAVIDPAVGHVDVPAFADLAPGLGVRNGTQVAWMIQTLRRKFRRVLGEIVRELVTDPADAEDEVELLRRHLGM